MSDKKKDKKSSKKDKAQYTPPQVGEIHIHESRTETLNQQGVAVPTIGRIVTYKSKIDNGPGNDVYSPAVVIRTRDTCVEAVAKRWGPEPTTVHSASDPEVTHETAARPDGVADVLEDDLTVDLLVHGLGKDYREYNVKYGDGFGEWSWPKRV